MITKAVNVADAARPSERHQPRAGDTRRHLLQVSLAADQRRQLRRGTGWMHVTRGDAADRPDIPR